MKILAPYLLFVKTERSVRHVKPYSAVHESILIKQLAFNVVPPNCGFHISGVCVSRSPKLSCSLRN